MKYLPVDEVAALLGISKQAVRKNATEGKYGEIRYEEGNRGRGGRVMMIPLSGLPAPARVSYLKRMVDVPEPTDDLSDLTQDERDEIGRKKAVLAAWWAYRSEARGGRSLRQVDREFVAMWQAQHPEARLSVPTLHRWDKAYREGGPRALLDRRGRARAGESSIPDDLWELYKSLYLTEHRRTHMYCYQFVRDHALLHGRLHEVPSESAFRRRAEREFDRHTLIFLRQGAKAWESLAAPYLEMDRSGVAPGAIYVFDHFQLDIAAVDEDGRVIRPWLSVAMDYRTRLYVGWAVTNRPCTDSTMAAAGMAFMNPERGVPDIIKLDNGREYTGYSFAGRGHRKVSHKVEYDEARIRSLVSHLGIATIFTTPEHPQGKGDVERSFRTVHEEFCKAFRSYLGNQPDTRPEDAEAIRQDKSKLLTLPEVHKWVSEYIVHVHNERPHQGRDMNGMSPRQVWDAEVHRRPVRYVDRDVLKLLLMPYAEGRLYTVQRGGLKVWGRYYWSEPLHRLLGEKVMVRYDQADASRIYVFRPDGSFVDAVPAKALGTIGSVDEAKAIHRQRARLRKELVEKRRELEQLDEAFILGTRIEAGRRRREEEQAAKPSARRVTQIHPVDPALRQAAKEVARAKEEAAAQEVAARAREAAAAALAGRTLRAVGADNRVADIVAQMDAWVKSGMGRGAAPATPAAVPVLRSVK